MLGEKILGIAEFRHHHPAVAIGLVVEIGMGGEHARRAAGRDQRGVERLVKRVEFRARLRRSPRGLSRA